VRWYYSLLAAVVGSLAFPIGGLLAASTLPLMGEPILVLVYFFVGAVLASVLVIWISYLLVPLVEVDDA